VAILVLQRRHPGGIGIECAKVREDNVAVDLARIVSAHVRRSGESTHPVSDPTNGNTQQEHWPKTQRAASSVSASSATDGVGFEPTVRFCRKHSFQGAGTPESPALERLFRAERDDLPTIAPL
jgi:hypothetical protein